MNSTGTDACSAATAWLAPPRGAPAPGGTGLRYIKARLEESFAGRWTFSAGEVGGHWQTTIELLHAPAESVQP